MNMNHSRNEKGQFCTYEEGDRAIGRNEREYWLNRAKDAIRGNDVAEARRCMEIRALYKDF